MKKTVAMILAAMLALTLSASALADTEITVSGTGQMQIGADTAVIMLGVSMYDKDALQAQQKVNERIAAIRQALAEIGIPEEFVTTNYINIYASYDYSEEKERLTAYCAGTSLSIRVSDMESAGRVIDAAFAAGANTLEGISFSAANTDDVEAEALRRAVTDARAKAEVLAAASGLKLKKIESISEGGTYSFDNSSGIMREEAATEEKSFGSTVIQAAKIVVQANVTVTFEAE